MIAKSAGLEPRRCEDIKGIVAPTIGPKNFGTFKKRTPGSVLNQLRRPTIFQLERMRAHPLVLGELRYVSKRKPPTPLNKETS